MPQAYLSSRARERWKAAYSSEPPSRRTQHSTTSHPLTEVMTLPRPGRHDPVHPACIGHASAPASRGTQHSVISQPSTSLVTSPVPMGHDSLQRADAGHPLSAPPLQAVATTLTSAHKKKRRGSGRKVISCRTATFVPNSRVTPFGTLSAKRGVHRVPARPGVTCASWLRPRAAPPQRLAETGDGRGRRVTGRACAGPCGGPDLLGSSQIGLTCEGAISSAPSATRLSIQDRSP
jgi:hypothetical protein